MKRVLFCFALMLSFVTPGSTAHATTLGPELKAMDFSRNYQLKDGGIFIQPRNGFYCPDGVQTPDGIRVMPGQTFIQFDEGKLIMEVYKFTRMDSDGLRAFFHEKRYHYKVEKNDDGSLVFVRDGYIDSNDFYLPKDNILDWFDSVFPYVNLQPGQQYWRTR